MCWHAVCAHSDESPTELCAAAHAQFLRERAVVVLYIFNLRAYLFFAKARDGFTSVRTPVKVILGVWVIEVRASVCKFLS